MGPLLVRTLIYLTLVIGPLAALASGAPLRGGATWLLALAFGYLGAYWVAGESPENPIKP